MNCPLPQMLGVSNRTYEVPIDYCRQEHAQGQLATIATLISPHTILWGLNPVVTSIAGRIAVYVPFVKRGSIDTTNSPLSISGKMCWRQVCCKHRNCLIIPTMDGIAGVECCSSPFRCSVPALLDGVGRKTRIFQISKTKFNPNFHFLQEISN